MKKFKALLFILILTLSISLIPCFCVGCDFVQYVEKSDNNSVVSDEVKSLQESYVEKLYSVTSEIEYRENEQKLYEYAMQDAVNELYECTSETDLKQVYDKHLTIIGNIKTDKEYSDEEEANAVSAYRTAILNQADESYDRQKYSQDQNTYLSSVFTAFSAKLFDTSVREEMNVLLQGFYFDVHKEDEVLSLINHADISAYEDSQQNILIDTLNTCTDKIRGCTDEKDIGDIKNVYIFEVYRRDTVKKLKTYRDLSLYRAEQSTEIQAILEEHLSLVEEAKTKNEIDNALAGYKTEVNDIKTNEELYSNELDELKNELTTSLKNSYKFSLYRTEEWLTVQELLSSFEDSANGIKRKEDVLSQYVVIKNRLDSVKTDKALAEEERLTLIEELHEKMINAIYKNIAEEEQQEYLAQTELVYSAMLDRVSLEGVRSEYSQFAFEIGVMDAYKEDLEYYKASVYYRENEQNQIKAIKDEYIPKFNDDLTIENAKAILQEAKGKIDEIKTNDDLWNESLAKFRADLRTLYGDAILEEPRSLTEANDYVELANIIDYYAFYQLSGTEFVCDTFRVKLNFDHNDATWERNEVYWYCELLKSAVDIQAEFENNSDNIVFYLTGYNFATESNKDITEPNTKVLNATQFQSDKTGFIARENNFDEFPYYQYNKSVAVHNSQQLWYALEHEYVPICKESSSAEQILNEAKKILREIIMEGMSDEEKIFQIYSWIGKNIQFDNNQSDYNFSSDPNNYPNEVISFLKSHFLEGGIFDRLTVCIGFSKTYLLLLRMEGIQAKINISRMPYMQGQNSITPISWAFHAFVYVNLNGKWYYSDSEKGEDRGNGTNSLQYIMQPKEVGAAFDERMNVYLEKGNDLDYYNNFTFYGKKTYVKSKEELIELLDILEINNVTAPISVFKGYDCVNDIIEYGSLNNINYNILNNSGFEIIIQAYR